MDMGQIWLTLHGYWYGVQLRYAHTPLNTSSVIHQKTFRVVLFSSANFAKIKVNIFEWFFLDTNVDFVNVKLTFFVDISENLLFINISTLGYPKSKMAQIFAIENQWTICSMKE